MDQHTPHRPRVSRETRLLLATAFISIAALWILARMRFPDQPAAPNPVQPLLTQLAARPRFDDLAAEIAQLHTRIDPLLVGAALRVRSDAAVTWLGEVPPAVDTDAREHLIGFDRASRLALVRVPFLPVPPPVAWKPGEPRQARYLIATDMSTGELTLRPVFVASLVPTVSPLWSSEIWMVPETSQLSAGGFVFTTDALLAGLVVEHSGRTAIVPGAVLLAEAERLMEPAPVATGYLGIDVQPLTRAIVKATGVTTGVVVTWVDSDGPAAGAFAAGDVLEAVDGEALSTPIHWEARASRLATGTAMTVRMRRGGEVRDVMVTAAAPAGPPATTVLGLTLRSIAGTGSGITAVAPGSVAERAGLLQGDIITRVGDVAAPWPASVRRAFERAASEGGAVLVAYTRGESHRVTALEK